MSTKTQDTNKISYDPGSMGVYSGLQQPISGTLQNFMANPLTSSFFNQRVGMGNKYIGQQGNAAMQSMFSNLGATRGSGASQQASSPFMQSMIARQGRATAGAKSNNFMQQLFNANQLQLGATGMAQSYNPLMTGSSSTQTKSGLGTWLPQLAGAALGGLTGGLTGGLSSMLGGLGGMGGGGGMSAPTSMSGVMGTVPGSNPFMGIQNFPSPIFMGLPGFGGNG